MTRNKKAYDREYYHRNRDAVRTQKKAARGFVAVTRETYDALRLAAQREDTSKSKIAERIINRAIDRLGAP